MRRSRADHNQQAIIVALRSVGAQVQSLSSVGHGCPDLLVFFRKKLFLLEVKNQAGRGIVYTPEQLKWRAQFQGASQTVCDAREALAAIGIRG